MGSKHAPPGRSRLAGLTLIELMLVVALVAVLAAIAMPIYSNYRERINRTIAIQDIKIIQLLISDYAASWGSFPASLADVGNGGKLDPWGHVYQYVDLTGVGGIAKARNTSSIRSIPTLICSAWAKMVSSRAS